MKNCTASVARATRRGQPRPRGAPRLERCAAPWTQSWGSTIGEGRHDGFSVECSRSARRASSARRATAESMSMTMVSSSVLASCWMAVIGLLLAHFAGTNLRGVPDPQFVTEFREQTLEPVNRTRRFNPHAHGLLQTAVERARLAACGPIAAQRATRRSLPWPWQSADSVCENHNL